MSACATTIEGTGRAADGLIAPAPTGAAAPTGEPTTEPSPTAEPMPSATSTAAPSPTASPVEIRQRLLCVTEQASITSINRRFNAAKSRAAQVTVLRSGATSVSGNLQRSGLPGTDRIYRLGKRVLDELNSLVRAAGGGGNPSTGPYNKAAGGFQRACNQL